MSICPARRKSVDVTVKSSMRTLEILEYCDSVQRPVTVSELVSRLGYPQSSTSVLVQSMVNAGYLAHDISSRGVLPTGRVALLGRWVQPVVARTDLKRLMRNLGAATGHTIVLGVPQGLFVRYLDVVPGRLAMRLEIPIGTKMPILASGMGTLLLSAMSNEAIAEIRTQTEHTLSNDGPDAIKASEIADLWNASPTVMPLPVLMSEIEKIRSAGYSTTLDAVTLGAGIVCMLLPTNLGEQPLGVGVAGLSTIIERDRDLLVETIIEESEKLGIHIQIDSKQPRSIKKRKGSANRSVDQEALRQRQDKRP